MSGSDPSSAASKIREIFLTAQEYAPGPQREAYLKEACGEDLQLYQQVCALLDPQPDAVGRIEANIRAWTQGGIPDLVGTQMGPYQLIEKLGEGGFGEVYRVEQVEPIRRELALKVIKPGMDSRRIIARFELERQALALMQHPNISQILDAGASDDGRPYFVMELALGPPITRYCDERRLSARERLELFHQVCLAIRHAHQRGILHRDLKPSNIVITEGEDGAPLPKIIDFGIAKSLQERLTGHTMATQSEAVVGTPAYMSPEQITRGHEALDTRSDVYSLGALLYELLAGTTPLDADTLRSASLSELHQLIQGEDPPSPSTRITRLGPATEDVAEARSTDPASLKRLLHGELDWITMKAIEKDRERRYQSVGELADDISRFLQNRPVEAAPPSRLYRARKFIRRHRFGVGLGTAVALSLAIGLILSLIGFNRAARERDRATLERDRARVSELVMQVENAKAQIIQGVLLPVEAASGSTSTSLDNPADNPSTGYGMPDSDSAPFWPDILAGLSKRVDEELKHLPEVEMKVRRTLSESYHHLTLLSQKELEMKRVVDLAREQFGPKDIRYADALVDYNNFTNPPPGFERDAIDFRTQFFQKFVPGPGFMTSRQILREPLGIYREHQHKSWRYGFALLYGNDHLTHTSSELEEVVRVFESIYGRRDRRTLISLYFLSRAHMQEGDFEQAMPLMEEYYQAHLDRASDPYFVLPLDPSGWGHNFYEFYGRFDLAEKLYRWAIQNLEKKEKGKSSFEYYWYFQLLSQLLVRQCRADPEIRTRQNEVYYRFLETPGLGAKVDYKLRINSPGRYRLYTRWDSDFYQIYRLSFSILELQDGPEGKTADWFHSIAGSLDWNADFGSILPWKYQASFFQPTRYSVVDYAEWDFPEPGTYTLQFLGSKSGEAIDAFILQKSNLPPPLQEGPARSPRSPDGAFVEEGGRLVVEAEHFSNMHPGTALRWRAIYPTGTDGEGAPFFLNFTGDGYIQCLPTRYTIGPEVVNRSRHRSKAWIETRESRLRTFTEAIQEDPSYENWLNRGRAALAMDYNVLARSDFTEAVQRAENPGPARLLRARCSLPSDIIADFTPDWRAGTASTDMKVYLAQALARLDRYEEAFQVVDPPSGEVTLWSMHGDLHAELGQWEQAIPCFLRAIELEPARIRSFGKLYLCCRMAGNLEPYTRALFHFPDSEALDSVDKVTFLWLTALAPDSCPRPDSILPVAESFLDRSDPASVYTLSEADDMMYWALYRAGQFERMLELEIPPFRQDSSLPVIIDQRPDFSLFHWGRFQPILRSMALQQVGRRKEALAAHSRATKAMLMHGYEMTTWEYFIIRMLLIQEAADTLDLHPERYADLSQLLTSEPEPAQVSSR